MNSFGVITRHDCVTLPAGGGSDGGGDTGGTDPRCSDPAFAIANPGICAAISTLVIKPAFALSCVLGSVQFKAFSVTQGIETDVSDKVIWATSNQTLALIGAVSGSATGLAQGEVTVSATYQGLTATADLTVMAGNNDGTSGCCQATSVAMMLVLDNSLSMSQAFSGAFTTRLDFAKAAAEGFAGEVNTLKDKIGLIAFNDAARTTYNSPTTDTLDVIANAASITQTQQKTSFFNALTDAISELETAAADLSVIVLISDGEDTSADAASGYTADNNPLALLSNFKDNGGVVICLGCRASGSGFARLSAFATGGFFINAYGGIETDSLTALSGLKGYICAGNCTPTGDIIVGEGKLNYDAFTNWNVTGSTVDLCGNGFCDFMPGNGLYVDLSGSGHVTPGLGRMVLKTPFTLVAGESYRIAAGLAANPVKSGGPYSARIKVFYKTGAVENTILDQLVVITGATTDFQPSAFTFVAPAAVDAYISIQEEGIPWLTTPNCDYGMYLGWVTFDNTSTSTNLLTEDFEDENLVFVPPGCGQSTLYAQYVGYNCYGVGCLDTPPGAQSPDPSPLVDIESGYTPPTVFSSTKTACAECPPSFVNQGESLVPTMTSATTPSGVASASEETANHPAWKAFTPPIYGVPIVGWNGGTTSPQWLRYDFPGPTIVASYGITANAGNNPGWLIAWQFQGSNDGTTWTVLDSQTGQSTTFQDLRFTIATPQSFRYYRIYITDWNFVGVYPVALTTLVLYGGTATRVCKTATATGATQAAADTAAYNAAMALAQAELDCQPIYSATEQVTLKCPMGTSGPDVTRSATATSHFGPADAEDKARAAATALAQAVIDADCAQSSNDQLITINDANTGVVGIASPFPAVKFVTGETGLITALTVSIYGLSHTHPSDIQMFLTHRESDGTLTSVGLMRGNGGSTPVVDVNLVFQDGAEPLPAPGAIFSGTYSPAAGGGTVWGFGAVNTPEAPTAPASFLLTDFIGQDPNGAWSLWVIDTAPLDAGSIALGFDLTITTA